MAGRILEGVEDFLGHSASTSGGAFLKDWKDDAQLDIVLHPKAPIAVLWSHRWHEVRENKKTGKTEIWSNRFNSMESEATLKRQHFRNDDGTREFPPQLCPFSLLIEWVREQIEDDQISWVDVIFEFESKKEDLEIMAGGFTGLFQSKHLDDDQLEALKKAKVVVKEAYKQNARAQLNYVFSIIKYEFPDEGCLIAMEGKALGQAMQKAIRDEKKKHGKSPEKGDPFTHPYAFRWEYDDKKSFDDKYNVIAMGDALPLTPELEEMFDEPPPSLTRLLDPSNVALLRESFEEHWVHEVVPPWDDIFAAAEKAVKGTPAAERAQDFDPANHPPKEEKKGKAQASVPAESKAAPAAPPPEEDEELECDSCHKGMKATEFTCPHCGQQYDPATGLRIEKKPEPTPEPAKSAATEDVAAAPKRRRGG